MEVPENESFITIDELLLSEGTFEEQPDEEIIVAPPENVAIEIENTLLGM